MRDEDVAHEDKDSVLIESAVVMVTDHGEDQQPPITYPRCPPDGIYIDPVVMVSMLVVAAVFGYIAGLVMAALLS